MDRLAQLEMTLHAEILIPIMEASLLAVLAAPGQITACVPFADLSAIRRVLPVLLQQRIEGPGTGIFVLLAGGDVLAQFAHRRLREKPPSGGVSVSRESIVADQALVDRSVALLRSLEFNGVAMVEYKSDVRTGQAYLMEVNGRFWGSLRLAVDAGVNFPVLLVAWALRNPMIPVTIYRARVRSRWWWWDVDQLLIRLRRSDDANDLPPGAPTRWQTLGQFLQLWRPGDRN